MGRYTLLPCHNVLAPQDMIFFALFSFASAVCSIYMSASVFVRAKWSRTDNIMCCAVGTLDGIRLYKTSHQIAIFQKKRYLHRNKNLNPSAIISSLFFPTTGVWRLSSSAHLHIITAFSWASF